MDDVATVLPVDAAPPTLTALADEIMSAVDGSGSESDWDGDEFEEGDLWGEAEEAAADYEAPPPPRAAPDKFFSTSGPSSIRARLDALAPADVEAKSVLDFDKRAPWGGRWAEEARLDGMDDWEYGKEEREVLKHCSRRAMDLDKGGADAATALLDYVVAHPHERGVALRLLRDQPATRIKYMLIGGRPEQLEKTQFIARARAALPAGKRGQHREDHRREFNLDCFQGRIRVDDLDFWQLMQFVEPILVADATVPKKKLKGVKIRALLDVLKIADAPLQCRSRVFCSNYRHHNGAGRTYDSEIKSVESVRTFLQLCGYEREARTDLRATEWEFMGHADASRLSFTLLFKDVVELVKACELRLRNDPAEVVAVLGKEAKEYNLTGPLMAADGTELLEPRALQHYCYPSPPRAWVEAGKKTPEYPEETYARLAIFYARARATKKTEKDRCSGVAASDANLCVWTHEYINEDWILEDLVKEIAAPGMPEFADCDEDGDLRVPATEISTIPYDEQPAQLHAKARATDHAAKRAAALAEQRAQESDDDSFGSDSDSESGSDHGAAQGDDDDEDDDVNPVCQPTAASLRRSGNMPLRPRAAADGAAPAEDDGSGADEDDDDDASKPSGKRKNWADFREEVVGEAPAQRRKTPEAAGEAPPTPEAAAPPSKKRKTKRKTVSELFSSSSSSSSDDDDDDAAPPAKKPAAPPSKKRKAVSELFSSSSYFSSDDDDDTAPPAKKPAAAVDFGSDDDDDAARKVPKAAAGSTSPRSGAGEE
ncbi:hypothetical protein M885DRAFT_586550 [Pelagophyceae sp. CCMP2097]|nr:hypothetical protein M885DRAFT_586550 [Pelagophyceae sp. CCMP2097]